MIRRTLILAIAAVTTLSNTRARGEDGFSGDPGDNPGLEELLPDPDHPVGVSSPTPKFEDNRNDLQKIADRWYASSGTDVMGFFRDNNFAQTGSFMIDSLERSTLNPSGMSHYDTITHLLDHNADPATGMTTDQARSALGSYTGRSYGNAAQAAHSSVKSVNRGILRHIDDINKTLGSGKAPQDVPAASSGEALASIFNPKNQTSEERLWIGGIGLSEELRDSSDGMPGYKFSGGGILTGYDHTVGAVSLGGAIGYSGGTFKDKTALSDNSKIDSYAANLYATYNPGGNLRAVAMAGYARSDVKLRKRRAGMAGNVVTEGMEEGKFGMDSYSLGARVGYETKFKDIVTLGVTGGVQYQHSRSGEFDSVFWSATGAGDSVMRVGQMRTNSLSLPIDITADYVVRSTCDSSLTVSGNVGYGFEFSNRGAHGIALFDGLGGSGVDFSARAPGRNSANVGAGVAYENDRLDLTAKYDLYVKSDYTAHQVTGNMGLKF